MKFCVTFPECNFRKWRDIPRIFRSFTGIYRNENCVFVMYVCIYIYIRTVLTGVALTCVSDGDLLGFQTSGKAMDDLVRLTGL